MSDGDPAKPTLYLLPSTSPEDIRQERALAELERRRGVRRTRTDRAREYGYGLMPEDDWANPFAPEAPDPHVVETLVSWVMSQERHVAVKVMDYLDNPNPDTLRQVKDAVDVQMTLEVHREVPLTLTELILKNLPADVPTLYDLARREHTSRRPEAAVRQIIRNLTKRGTIAGDSEGVYHVLQRSRSGSDQTGQGARKAAHR